MFPSFCCAQNFFWWNSGKKGKEWKLSEQNPQIVPLDTWKPDLWPGQYFSCHGMGKNDQKACKLRSNGEKQSDFLPRSFFQIALPGIYIVVSKNMLVVVCGEPEDFSQNLRLSRTIIFFPRIIILQNLPPDLWNAFLIALPEFFSQ